MTSPSFSKGIHSIYRILTESGKEYIRVPEHPKPIQLEWNPATVEKLMPHFTDKTEFYIKDEKKFRTYKVPQQEWQELASDALIDYGIYGSRREKQ